MKKQLLKSALIAVAGVGFLAGSAMADSEPSLDTVLANAITSGYEIKTTDDTGVEAWTQAEAVTDSYLISLLSSATGSLYIYSTTTGADYLLGTFNGSTTAVSFGINDYGDLYINGSATASDYNFGEYFGFYWKTSIGKSYTESDRNVNNEDLAYSFAVAQGTEVFTQLNGGTTVIAGGGNDWILAFEDTPSLIGGDNDHQDAILYFEDMNAVPEPATMLLFGTGLVGLAGAARRKKANK